MLMDASTNTEATIIAGEGFRLSAQQERVWTQTAEAGLNFWAECEVLVEGALDVARLKESFRQVVRRHEILRTVFQRQPGLKVAFQVILDEPETECLWQDVDLSTLAQPLRREKILELVVRQQATVSLGHGPVLTVLIARLASGSWCLVFSLPALCADLSSLRNLIDAVGRGYAGLEPDGTSEVLQYVDVAQWQEELLTGEDTRAGRDFWRGYCRNLDFEAGNSVLSSFEAGSEAAFAPSVVVQEVEASFASKIAAASSSLDASEADVLLTCWGLFLARITGRPMITIGSESDGRKYEELHDALGLFAKYLPLQFTASEGMPFRALVEQMKTCVEEGRKWQESFSWAHVELSAPQLPLAFDYAELADAQIHGGVKFTMTRLQACAERFKVKLSARRSAESLRLEFHYDEARLERETVERWSRHFLTLLAAAVDRPERAGDALPLPSASERHRILSEWNQTVADYPKERCFHEMFEDQAARTPDRVAVRCETRQLSYRELNEQANRLAHALRRRGVGSDTPVGLCLERGVEMIVALLGVFKAGGTYVPLSPDHPKPRLAHQLAGAAVLVTQENLLGHMPEFGGQTICLDKDQSDLENEPTTNPELMSNPENLAYIIYTSGSTGVPKGVGVRHRNLMNYTWFMTRLLDLEQHPAGLQFATVSTLSADLGNTCVYPALISGGCVHVIPYEVAGDSQRLEDYNSQYAVDVLKIVPSHLSALLDSGGTRELLPRKYLVTGGELLTQQLVQQILRLEPECEIVNHYGPTETTIGSLTLRLKDYDWHNSNARSIPIGRPIANTSVYILDAHREPVPVGVAGELFIAGAGVAAGYINQPALTAERFLADPFAEDPHQKMYRTGDLARYLPDGNVEFLGRADDQVKIRGFRIEPREVEAVLARHESVKQAVVLARADGRGDKRLFAYVVLQGEPRDASDMLRRYLKEHLPDYMVPGALVIMPRLPLNANGKIDRQKLPEPEQAASGSHAYVAPGTPTETVIAGIWADVLHRDQVGVEDNFFEIGGHSLLATQVISRVRRSLEIDPPLRLLFESPTVEMLAAWVDRARHEGQNALPPPITPVSREAALPLSFAQQRLWVVDQLEPNNPLYNVPRTLRLRGNLNIEAFGKSLDEIVRRHESLRTTFAVHNGEPVQVIADPMTVAFPLRDLTDLPETERVAAARQIARQEALQPFDLAKGPLVRAQLLRLAPDDHVFLLTAHHIVSDAWSAGIFLQELGAIYEAFSQGKPSPLPKLTLQYADYAAWQRQWLRGETLGNQLAYWREHLRGAPPVLELPFDRPRSGASSFDGSLERIEIPAEVGGALKTLSRQEDVTLFMTLLAGFQALLSRYSGQQQVVIGTDVANRTSTEAESLIGFLVNLLALRTDLSGDPTFRELLGRVRKVALDAYAHQDMPFDKLVEELQPERAVSYHPLVQALFVMQNIPSVRRALAGLELSAFEMRLTFSKFDLAVFMTERDDLLIGAWVYRTCLFERETIRRFARHYEALLRSAVAQPDTRLSALEMLSEEERQQRGTEQRERKQAQRGRLIATEPKRLSLSGQDTV
jgi:amino acid adenylation domain-containing protein